MSEQSPYELLGVTEGASFDEIQAARDRWSIVSTVPELKSNRSRRPTMPS